MAPTNVCPHLVGYRGGTDSADGSFGDSDVRGGDDGVNGIGGDGGTALGGKDDGDNTNGGGGPREALCIGNGDDVDACQGGVAGMSSGIQGTAHNGTSDTAAKVGKAIASASSKAVTGCGTKVSAITARGVAGCNWGSLCAGMVRVPSAAELGQAGSPASLILTSRLAPAERQSNVPCDCSDSGGNGDDVRDTNARHSSVGGDASSGGRGNGRDGAIIVEGGGEADRATHDGEGECHCVFREELQPVPSLFRSVKYTSTSHHFGSPRMQHCHSDL